MIYVKGLSKSFGDNQVIKNINMHITPGEKVVIIGPSGSGKSTFLRCLNLLEIPTGGTITFDGQEITAPGVDINKVRRHMGMVFQHFNLFNNLTVKDNIMLGPVKQKLMTKEEAEAEAMRLLKLVNLEEKADAYPAQLSGGMQQRVAIARALAVEPEILFMDEPFGALDAITRMKLQKDVLKIAHETDKTVVFVTHDIEEAIFLADRIVIMSANPGKVKSIMKVTLPKDRDRTSDDFLLMRDKVYEIFQMKEERNIEYFI